jgi:tetratricopeptide (TPR) repeat protein
VASILTDLGDYSEALRLYYEVDRCYRSMGDKRGLAMSTGSIGEIQLLQGRWEQALVKFRETEEIARKINDHESMIWVAGYIGRALCLCGRLEEAKQSFIHQIELCGTDHQRPEAVLARAHQAVIAAARGEAFAGEPDPETAVRAALAATGDAVMAEWRTVLGRHPTGPAAALLKEIERLAPDPDSRST